MMSDVKYRLMCLLLEVRWSFDHGVLIHDVVYLTVTNIPQRRLTIYTEVTQMAAQEPPFQST